MLKVSFTPPQVGLIWHLNQQERLEPVADSVLRTRFGTQGHQRRAEEEILEGILLVAIDV